MSHSFEPAAPGVRKGPRISLTTWIILALFAGLALGYFARENGVPHYATNLKVLSDIFLRLVKSILSPLIFATLVYGIAGMGSPKDTGRIGAKAIIYFELATTAALFLGLFAVNFIRPGDGVSLEGLGQPEGIPKAKVTLEGVILHAFPSSLIEAMAANEVLQIVCFAVFFGFACSALGPKAKPVVNFCQSLGDVMLKYTQYVMYFAPLGVLGATATTVAKTGFANFALLGKLVLTLYATLIVFVVVVLGSVILVCRLPLRRLFNAVREPFILAFSTASSESAFPKALENMERFGVPSSIVGFVLPTGYSFNLDGSTLYLSLASIFVAQAAKIEVPLGTQILMMLTLMLTSKGVAAVPRASLVILSGTLTAFGLPLEGITLILGVDAFMDMARTSINVLGNCVASAVVARWEGVTFDPSPQLGLLEDEKELAAQG